ncbi:MAG: type II toxin-antitoxin system HicA family toxin [Clostridiaceae bacterium]|nr:type II toxin-antitoxin system HicA family toxin [Clostridiaceae bacterium]
MNRIQREWKMHEWERILVQNGWYKHRSGKGSHQIWTNGKAKMAVPRKLNSMIALRLIKEHNIVVG